MQFFIKNRLILKDHYDFGMRAVKTVIAVAGNLKRENSEMDEQQIVLRALKDVNVPKFLNDDLKLFNGNLIQIIYIYNYKLFCNQIMYYFILLGIVSDLFPLIEQQVINYGSLEKSIRDVILSFELDDIDSK